MSPSSFLLGNRAVDLTTRSVRHTPSDAIASTLTELEAKLLERLLLANGALVDKPTLLREVWGYADGVESRAVDYTVRRLRKKLEDTPRSPAHLVSVYGGGIGLQKVTFDHQPGTPPDTRPPLSFDTFVGRRPELERLSRWLDDGARVVQVLGAGGVGKTRFALEWVRTRPTDAQWWVALGAVRDDAGLARAVCAAVGRPGTDATAALAQLSGVLVLDEAEGCVDALSRALPVWLQHARALQLVLTSRIPVSVSGILPLRLGRLTTPNATRLYEARAAAAGALHALDDPHIPQLVDRLEGSPLAIELAAARAGVRPVPELLAALDRPLDTLRHPHQPDRSLREVLAWSWALLTPAQARILAACSVFPGRFGRDNAETVAGPDAVVHLDALHAQSLVHAHPGTRRTFSLAMGVREFAAEQLSTTDAARIEDQLVAHVLQRTGHGRRPPQRAWIMDELELLRSLLARLTARNAPDTIALATAVAPTLADHGLQEEALAPLTATANQPGIPAVIRAQLLSQDGDLVGALEGLQHSLDADDPATRRLALLERAAIRLRQTLLDDASADMDRVAGILAQHPDPTDRARLFNLQSILHRIRGEWDDALHTARSCALTWNTLGDDYGHALGLSEVGMALRGAGRLDEARHAMSQAIDYFEEVGAMRKSATLYVNLGVIDSEQGARQLAAQHYRLGLDRHRRSGNRQGTAYACLNLALIARWNHDDATSEALLLEARQIARTIGDKRIQAFADGNDAVGHFQRGDHPSAVRTFEAARAQLQAIGAGRTTGWFATYEAVSRRVLGTPEPTPFDPLASTGFVAATEALLRGQADAARQILDTIPERERLCDDGQFLESWLRGHIARGTHPGPTETA